MNEEHIDESLDLNSKGGSYQLAAYSAPNYTNLSSASKALDDAIGTFFNTCMEKGHGR
jgi:hypothetical protein